MPAFTVTASNKFYWQTLMVDASNVEDAERKFEAYLASPENKEGEQYEYNQNHIDEIRAAMDTDDLEMTERGVYNYELGDIEEDSWWPEWCAPSSDVKMLESGGNG